VTLKIAPPSFCHSNSCMQLIVNKIRSHIDTLYNAIQLLAQNADNQTVNIQLIFCSFIASSTGKALCHLFRIRLVK